MKLHRIVTTQGIYNAGKTIPMFTSFVRDCLDRFFSADYGEMREEDLLANTRAQVLGGRIFASYDTELVPEKKIYIIADAEDDNGYRDMTILYPSEY